MTTTIIIDEVVIDDAKTIIEELEKGDGFQLMIYDSTEEKPCVGIWLEHVDKSKQCTIMFDISKEQALFLGKSLLALAKSI
jgi:hypothetical protein